MSDIEAVLQARFDERKRCIAICESWIGTFQGVDIKFTSPRAYAVDAIEDIIDLIREGHQPGAAVGAPGNPGASSQSAESAGTKTGGSK